MKALSSVIEWNAHRRSLKRWPERWLMWPNIWAASNSESGRKCKLSSHIVSTRLKNKKSTSFLLLVGLFLDVFGCWIWVIIDSYSYTIKNAFKKCQTIFNWTAQKHCDTTVYCVLVLLTWGMDMIMCYNICHFI